MLNLFSGVLKILFFFFFLQVGLVGMQQTSGMVTPGSGGGCAATAPGLDAPEGAAALHHPDQAQLEADKRSVYK